MLHQESPPHPEHGKASGTGSPSYHQILSTAKLVQLGNLHGNVHGNFSTGGKPMHQETLILVQRSPMQISPTCKVLGWSDLAGLTERHQAKRYRARPEIWYLATSTSMAALCQATRSDELVTKDTTIATARSNVRISRNSMCGQLNLNCASYQGWPVGRGSQHKANHNPS